MEDAAPQFARDSTQMSRGSRYEERLSLLQEES
jgi:hypothetical protein